MGMGQPFWSDGSSCELPTGKIPLVCETVEETKLQLGSAGEISERKGHSKKTQLSDGRVKEAELKGILCPRTKRQKNQTLLHLPVPHQG